jgi:hypothetical protein
MTAIVTSGYGYFGIPVRLGAGPEIVVIDIVPLKRQIAGILLFNIPFQVLQYLS